MKARQLRQLAQLGRQPLEPIVADLEHRFASDHDPQKSNFALRAARAVSSGRFQEAETKAGCRWPELTKHGQIQIKNK
jgi:hypothetical protein